MMDRLATLFYLVFATFMLFGLVGCQNDKSGSSDSDSDSDSENTTGQQVMDDQTGAEIWQATLDRYQNAPAYSDSAVLYVSYRIQENLIQEPKPWSLKYRRPGELEAGIYNSEISAANGMLSCFVYDIGTGNLDGQNVVRRFDEASFLGGLTDDPIALHFLSGANDLPVAEGTTFELIPPTLSLLTNNSKHRWLSVPTSVKRFQDDLVEGVPCYVVRVFGKNGKEETATDVWIGKQDGLIWQMLLPNAFLAAELSEAPEITGLQLIARFNDASFSCNEEISIKSRPETTPVNQFVKLPESLPTELIGQPLNPFQLVRSDQKVWTQDDLDNSRPTVMAWFVGPKGLELTRSLLRVKNQIAANSNLIVVFSDDTVSQAGKGLTLPSPLLTMLSENSIDWLYDSGLDACAALRIEAVPSLIVIDEQRKISFAQKLGEPNWENELVVALQRIRAGENVAAEMLAEYRSFLESYAQRLTAQSVNNPMKLAKFGAGDKTRPNRLKSRLIWELKNIKEPGNIYQAANGDLLVFDGWQSIARCDRNGAVIEREVLPVPKGYAANRLVFDKQRNSVAVYQASGNQVFVLDETWERVGNYPGSRSELGPITFASFLSGPTPDRLMVGFVKEGVHSIDLTTGIGRPRSRISLTSATPDLKYGVSNGRLIKFQPATGEANSIGKDRLRWRLIDLYLRGSYWGIAEESNGEGNMVFLDSNGRQTSKVAIGQFVVETDSLLLDCLEINSMRIGAVLVRPNELVLIKDEKEVVGILEMPRPIEGFRLVDVDGSAQVMIATSTGLKCVEIPALTN